MKLFRASNSAYDSQLFNEQTFYEQFLRDVQRAHHEILIESPFLTTKRVQALLPALNRARSRGVVITVNTKPLKEHYLHMRFEALQSIELLQGVGVRILYTIGHHRKLAIIDRSILWEGSLNILSQNDSCEMMRRTQSEALCVEMIQFTKLDKFLS